MLIVRIICQVRPVGRGDTRKQTVTDARVVQIISLQTIHYLTLSILTPTTLTLLTSGSTLTYSGGPSTVSHILDWRETASRPTVSSSSFSILSGMGIGLDSAAEGWKKLRGAWAGGKHVGSVDEDLAASEGNGGSNGPVHAVANLDLDEDMWDLGVDERRGWVLAVLWIVASAVEYASTHPRYARKWCMR